MSKSRIENVLQNAYHRLSGKTSIHHSATDRAQLKILLDDVAQYQQGLTPLGDLLRRYGLIGPRATVTVNDPDVGSEKS